MGDICSGKISPVQYFIFFKFGFFCKQELQENVRETVRGEIHCSLLTIEILRICYLQKTLNVNPLLNPLLRNLGVAV
jgi:hypothetical protein